MKRGRLGWIGAGIVVVALAAPAPALEVRSESGPVSASVRIAPDAPRIGDPLRLELEVVAEAGVELLMPEFGEALDRFRIVDFAPSESIDDEGRTVSRQVYTLQPSRSGGQSVPPLLIEFVDRRPGRSLAPEDADAYELLTERLALEVASVLPGDGDLDLRSALGPLPPLSTGAVGLWPWALGGAALLGGGVFAARGWLAALFRRRRSSAYERARADLDALLYGPRPTGEAIDAFYVKLSGIVRRYLEDRFGLRSPEQTTEEFLDDLVRSPDLVRAHQDLLREFLRGADLVKFAHHVPDAEGVEGSIGLAQRFLAETQERPDA